MRLSMADAFVVAGVLAEAVRDEAFDLVLTGLQSDDQGSAQTGVILAETAGDAARDDRHGRADPGAEVARRLSACA